MKQPEGDQRVYRMSTYDITTDEILKSETSIYQRQ